MSDHLSTHSHCEIQRPLFGRWIEAIFVVLALLLAVAPTAHARSITIQSFDADIAINPDGHIVVSEKIRFYFQGAWNGIIRSIPV